MFFFLFLQPSLSFAGIQFTCARSNGHVTFLVEGSQSRISSHYNWFRADALRDRGAAQGMLEPLFLTDVPGKPARGWLARRAVWNADFTRLEIEVERLAAWSDGKRVTAADLALSFQIALDHQNLDGPHLADFRRLIKAVRVVGVRELQLDFTEPAPQFIEQHLAPGASDGFVVVPAHIWGEINPERFDNPRPIGTGPYLFGEDGQWRRNDRWWARQAGKAQLPAPRALVWVAPIKHPHEPVLRWIACGGVDLVRGLPPGEMAGLAAISARLAPIFGVGQSEAGLVSSANWSGWPRVSDPKTEDWTSGQRAQQVILRLRPSN
ncbi:ABC transporter substrate-binding protein [Paracoccus yeei]|nr:ABC transporter substrate-binding protein [Paracoccus yeei]